MGHLISTKVGKRLLVSIYAKQLYACFLCSEIGAKHPTHKFRYLCERTCHGSLLGWIVNAKKKNFGLMVCQWGESGLIQICSHNYSIPADVNFPRLSLPYIHVYEVILSGYCSQLCYHSLFTTYAADTRVSIDSPSPIELQLTPFALHPCTNPRQLHEVIRPLSSRKRG